MIYPLCNFLLWNIKWVKGTSKSMARTCPYAFQHSYWLVLEKKTLKMAFIMKGNFMYLKRAVE